MQKRFSVILIMMIMLLTLCFQAGAEDEAFTLAGYDSNTSRDWASNAFFAREKEAVGFGFNFRQYSDRAEWKKAVASMQPGSDLPDALFMADLSGAECIRLRENGVLIDLKPYLEQYCPNLCGLIGQYPEILDAITLPDGSIAALPYVNETPLNCGIWVNRKWLTAVKADMPTDLESLEKVLRLFYNGDPNRNGKQDEIPLAFLGTFDLKFLAHAWGLVSNDYHIFVDEGGKVQYMPLQPEYREFVSWCRNMFSEKLLDPSGFTTADTLRTVSDSKAAQLYGMVITTSITNFLPQEWLPDYELMMPLSYNGRQVFRDYFGHVRTGTFAVTSACSDVGKLLSWVDRLYGHDIAVLASVGLENIEYTCQGDGRWHLVNINNANEIQSSRLLTGGSAYPGYSCDEFQALYYQNTVSEQLEAYRHMNALSIRPFPYYTLTKEQEDIISPLQDRLARETDMQTARWISGEDELTDESYNAFCERLDKMGLKEFLDFWQTIAD